MSGKGRVKVQAEGELGGKVQVGRMSRVSIQVEGVLSITIGGKIGRVKS